MKILKRKKIIIPLFVVVLLFLVTHSCMTFRMSEKKIDRFFEGRNVAATQHEYKVGFRKVHYVKSGDEKRPLVLFLHGSPGSLSAFIDYLADSTLLKHALLITADRPGFGYSNFGYGEPSLQKQAETLLPILDLYKNNKPIILVGHSLGGPLIAQMAIDYPQLIGGLIIVAGSIDPDLEPNEKWFRTPLATPFLRWLVPRSFRASNDEIYHLKEELTYLIPYWKDITCPVTVIHGTKDSLVPFGNVAFARKMLVNAKVDYVLPEDVNHFIPWSHPQLIKDAVLKMVAPSD